MKNNDGHIKNVTLFRWLKVFCKITVALTFFLLILSLYLIAEDLDLRSAQLHYCQSESVSLRTLNNIISPYNIERRILVENETKTVDTIHVQANGSWQRIEDLGCEEKCEEGSNKNWQQVASGQLTFDELNLIKRPFDEDNILVDYLQGGSANTNGEFIYFVESKLQPPNRYYNFVCDDITSEPTPLCQLVDGIFETPSLI